MAWLTRRTRKTLGVGLVGLFVCGGAAWGQAPLLVLPPSNLNPGETSQGFINFGCYDGFTFKPVDCGVTVTLGPIDPATTTPPFFGGHVAHSAPQPLGTVKDATEPGAGGVSVTGRPLKGFTVAYTAPEASGEVAFVTTWTPPPGYLFCIPSCTVTDHFDVGLQGLNELSATFKPRPSADLHPRAHFGTAALQQGITLIGKTYADLTGGRRPQITDMSLPVGGLFDICGTFKADGTCPEAPKGGHVWHRTGRDVDFSKDDDAGESIDCLLETTDAMIDAFKKAKVTWKQCYPAGHYHVRVR